MSNNVINIWYCAADVERSLGISHGNIAACCSGNMAQQSAGGYKWYYLYDKITDKKNILGAISLQIISEQDINKYIDLNNEGDKNEIQINR